MSVTGELLTGDGSVDRLTGGSGNDTLVGNGGDDVLKGGDGVDTAVFAGSITDYTWVTNSKGYEISGPDGVDDLISIEVLQFDDFSYNLDGNNEAIVVYPEGPLETDVNTSIEFSMYGYDIDAPGYNFYITNYVPRLTRTEYTETVAPSRPGMGLL